MRSKVKSIGLILLGAVAGILVSLNIQAIAERAAGSPLPVQELRAFTEVFGAIKENYVEPVSDKKLITGAINGMLSDLDPHSAYLDQDAYRELQVGTEGQFGGLGIEVGMEDGFVKVISPIEDTPAFRAGVKPGDLIVKLDETPVKGMTLNDAVKRMRGKPGSKITLTIARKGETAPIVVTLTRAIIKVQSVKSKMIEPGYGWVRISQFQEATAESLAKQVDALYKRGALKGLVLDLRNDPGGLLYGAVGVASEFLPKDALVVYTDGRAPDSKKKYFADPEDYLRDSAGDTVKDLPAAVKTVAEWFPLRERAFATGLFNAGSNVGALLAPLVVPIAVGLWGLRSGFLLTGVLSAGWLIIWLRVYRPPDRHRRVSARELAHIRADEPTAPAPRAVRWRELLRHRQTWAFVAGKFLTDPVWWFLLFWLPKYLSHRYGLDLTSLALPLISIYAMADAGSIGGGWLAGRLMRAGWSRNTARKGAMLLCALAVVPVAWTSAVHELWAAVGLIGLAAAAHQGWSANLFTTASDLYPSTEVASVVGLGGFAGAISGALVSTAVGVLLQATGSYALLFGTAGGMYLLALAVIQGLAPRLSPIRLAGA